MAGLQSFTGDGVIEVPMFISSLWLIHQAAKNWAGLYEDKEGMDA